MLAAKHWKGNLNGLRAKAPEHQVRITSLHVPAHGHLGRGAAQPLGQRHHRRLDQHGALGGEAGHDGPAPAAQAAEELAGLVVQVQVEKRSGGNAVEVSRSLRESLPRIEANLPFDARLIVDSDEGEELDPRAELVRRASA